MALLPGTADALELQFRGSIRDTTGEAIDSGRTNEAWLTDAKLCYGQCLTKESMPIDAVNLEVQSTLVSHSDDYFRLFEMPIEDGRILKTPEALRTRYDKKNDYHSTMHWLPSKRHAFYASYGRAGRHRARHLPSIGRWHGEFMGSPSDCQPPSTVNLTTVRQSAFPWTMRWGPLINFFFSSSRPESFGGLDVFQVSG